MVRLVSDAEIATALVDLPADDSPFAGLSGEMLDHGLVGQSLRNYANLTRRRQLVDRLQLDEQELFCNRYYWLARFAQEWSAVVGFDAGLEQQVFQLLESRDIDYDSFTEIEAAVARDSAEVRRQTSVDNGVRE